MCCTYGGWFASAGNGLQGFQTPIKNDSFVVDGMGALGNVHTERGLTYYEVALSGHMCVSFHVCDETLANHTAQMQGPPVLAEGTCWLPGINFSR